MAQAPATANAGESAALKTDADYKLAFKRIDAVTMIVKTVCKYACPVGCVYFAYKIVEVLAGRATVASFAMSVAISVLGNDKVFKIIASLITGGSIIYGVSERRLRRRVTQRLTLRPGQLERLIDPKRTSSGLTPKGTTRPEDRT